MTANSRATTLNIREMKVPYRKGGASTGKLSAATAHGEQPGDISDAAWSVALIREAKEHKPQLLVIPTSFWPSGEKHAIVDSELVGVAWVELTDKIDDIGNQHGATPTRGFRVIIDALGAGKDVMVMSRTGLASGFVPAVVCKALDPTAHTEKIAYPLIAMGFALSQFELGYLYGMTGSQLRKQN